MSARSERSEPRSRERKAAECERARGYLKGIEEGQRIVRSDAAGNREYLDDNQRAAEAERTRKIVQSTCN